MKLDFDCYQALRARDARFDGRFFVGVKTTGIYCRPVCPARTPRASSCVFVATAAGAERAGFRPCLRCRPELAPPAPATARSATLEQALFAAIRARVAHGDSVDQLAGRTGFSPRQLRRLTVRAFGVTPVEIVQTERLLFAKKLLQETTLPMMDVALSAGFGSLRRFNASFLARYRMPPTALRRQSPARHRAAGQEDGLTLRLTYRPPLAWRELLDYLAKRAVPGVESVARDAGTYSRTVRIGEKTGWVTVGQSPHENALEVRVPAALADVLWSVLMRLRALLDLDANPLCVDEQLGIDPVLATSVQRHPGLRVPGAWDPFELAVRAVLGQQISVAGASTLAARLAARFGTPVVTPHAALNRLAPTAATLAAATLEDLAALGLTRARAQTLRDLAAAAVRGELAFRPADGVEDVASALRRIRGIGEWTAQYVAMRALRFPDAFPAGDLGLRKALAPPGGPPVSEVALLARSQPWRPWRAYAALHLWQTLHDTPTQPTR